MRSYSLWSESGSPRPTANSLGPPNVPGPKQVTRDLKRLWKRCDTGTLSGLETWGQPHGRLPRGIHTESLTFPLVDPGPAARGPLQPVCVLPHPCHQPEHLSGISTRLWRRGDAFFLPKERSSSFTYRYAEILKTCPFPFPLGSLGPKVTNAGLCPQGIPPL